MPPAKKPLELTEDTKMSETLFTPGKLADETQLGSITSLINSGSQHLNPSKTYCITETDKPFPSVPSPSKDEMSQYDQLSPPVSSISLSMPSKPFKKRMIHQNKDNKRIVRSIFSTNEDSNVDECDSSINQILSISSIESTEPHQQNSDLDLTITHQYPEYVENLNNNLDNDPDSNVTKQELIEKVVDHMCTASTKNETDLTECVTCLNRENKITKEHRTSVRSCKGLRYAKFMAEGKLLVNKRSKKYSSSSVPIPRSMANPEGINQVPRRESIELNETIKKLAERTSKSVNMFTSDFVDENQSEDSKTATPEPCDDNVKKMFNAADFNLDEKIEALPSLSLEKFQQKKKESKKKKFFRNAKPIDISEHKKDHFDVSSKMVENNNTLIGSRKRKPRKQSITRLDPQSDIKFSVVKQPETDLFALVTLADVAAKKAKIDQQ